MENKNIALELRKMANIMKRTFDKFLDGKVTNTQRLILNYIYDNNNLNIKVYQKNIEDFFEIRRSTVCEILNIMERDNLIKRIPSENDLRSNEIKLDKNGELFLKEFKSHTELLETIMQKDISYKELEIFLLVLERFRKNLEEIC